MQLINTTVLTTLLIGFASHTYACAFQGTINGDQYLTSTMKQDGTETCKINGYGDNTGYTYDCNSGYYLRCNNALSHCTYKSSRGTFVFSAGNPTVYCAGQSCYSVYTANPACGG